MSLYVLDTDILSLVRTGHPKIAQHLLQHSPGDLAVSVLTAEEVLSGWFAQLRRVKARDQLAHAYRMLADSVTLLTQFQILTFTEPAMARFDTLLALKLGVRAMDLRIAAVVLEHAAILVTRTLRDFTRVPGLTVEDWTA